MNDSAIPRKIDSLPADLCTGVPAIDRYLEQINARLTGSATIRRATLSEARDFILDATAGTDDREAAIGAAIDEFGSPQAIGASQRRERRLIFLKLALATGPAFAVLMLVAGSLGLPSVGERWGLHAGIFVFNMLAFGVSMGAVFAYVIGVSRPAPAAFDAAAGEDGFLVAYRKSSHSLCWVLLIVFGTLQIFLLLALADVDPTGFFTAWPWPLTAFMLVLGIKNAGAPLHALQFRARVARDMLVVHRMGAPLQLRRNQVVSVATPGFLRQFFSTRYGNQRRIGWRAEDDSVRVFTLSLTFDVVNGDRLLAWLESAAQENQDRT